MGKRIATGVVAGAGFVALLAAGGWAFAALLALMAMLGYWEFARLNGLSVRLPEVWAGLAAALVLATPAWPFGWTAPAPLPVVWILAFFLLAATVIRENRFHVGHAAVLFLGAVYIGFGFRSMALVRGAEDGLFWAAAAFACVWAADIGAYFTGRAFGRRKLWPSISPNKTVEGAVGGLAASVLAALAAVWIWPGPMGFGHAAVFGLAAGAAGQLGDLIQSAYKRHSGVKDAGRLLPGHGGVLDRTDSWLIAFPVLQLLALLPGA
ncbi:MAG: phosphatidate cytidylyltransferase [Paenibacillaceae bacterium ZCTH02-B3]|nr:MAG: phosphatidate cytidylyltransferase [Paenibacillaceae bacterium ZCTH02-B3]